jgi:glycogen operon protein
VKLLRDNTWLHLILNAYWQPLDFALPTIMSAGSSAWHRWIDTSQPSPNDIVPWEEAPECPPGSYRGAEHSVAVLIAGEGVGPRRGG